MPQHLDGRIVHAEIDKMRSDASDVVVARPGDAFCFLHHCGPCLDRQVIFDETRAIVDIRAREHLPIGKTHGDVRCGAGLALAKIILDVRLICVGKFEGAAAAAAGRRQVEG